MIKHILIIKENLSRLNFLWKWYVHFLIFFNIPQSELFANVLLADLQFVRANNFWAQITESWANEMVKIPAEKDTLNTCKTFQLLYGSRNTLQANLSFLVGIFTISFVQYASSLPDEMSSDYRFQITDSEWVLSRYNVTILFSWPNHHANCFPLQIIISCWQCGQDVARTKPQKA